MNDIGIVRLEGFKIKNFQNIESGEINFSEAKKIQRGDIDEDDFKNIIGLYGQNGSGKTGCLNALRVLQCLLSGSYLNSYFNGFVMIDKEDFSISADFLIKINNGYYYINYDVTINKNRNALLVSEEKLSIKNYSNNLGSVSYKYEIEKGINNSFLNLLSKGTKSIYEYIAKYESNGLTNISGPFSTIFNPKLYELIVKKENNKFGIYVDVIRALRVFAISRFAIYSINYFNETDQVGIRFRFKEESFNEQNDSCELKCGDIFVPFKAQNKLKKDIFMAFEKTILKINKVLPSIVPNFCVEIKFSDENIMNNKYNTDDVSFFLIGKRNGKEIPLQYESNGIKKIISILSGLIEAYTSEGCLMAIDEIDSGIFEYLLGELVYAFDNFANGQLIFTSHNMRILEKISYKNVFFTTTNSKKAFVQLKNVKENNNLRDLYYRYLINGDNEGNEFFDLIKTEDLVSSLGTTDGDIND